MFWQLLRPCSEQFLFAARYHHGSQTSTTTANISNTATIATTISYSSLIISKM